MTAAEDLEELTLREPSALPVLIAEDDPIFRRVLENWLSSWGYQVTAVEDGTMAWEALLQKEAPKLLILDWMMPGMDGPELCHKVRDRKQVPYSYILLVTSKDEKQDLIHGLNAGADDYITKPFDLNELKARLRVGTRILFLQDELIRAKEQLEFQATHDPLTGLWNRGAILDLLHRELDRAARSEQSMALFMLDIDHFKQINDSHGHLVGDQVLREVAKRLTSCVRSYDWAGRYGGEEFLVVGANCSGDALKSYAERLRLGLAETPVVTDAGGVLVTASVGAAHTKSCQCNADCLLHAADAALYRAKENGRNRVELA